MVKRNWFVIFLAIALAGMPSCTQSPDCLKQDILCAALVTDTAGLEDHGINQETWAGLMQAKEDGTIGQADYIESVDSRDYEKNIAYFADRGYDVIITANPGMRKDTLRGADLYPDSVFVGMNQTFEDAPANLVSISFPEDEMGFLAGILAARLTKTKVVGAACESSDLDSMWRYCEGFRAGAAYADPGVKVLIQYRDDGDSEKFFVDEAWGTGAAQYLIRYGSDVIFAAGGVTAQSALRAALDEEILVIGAERNQAAALGESSRGVVTSIYGDARFEVQEMMRLIRGGKVLGEESGQIQFVPLNGKFPEAFSSELDEIVHGFSSGEIMTNVTNSKQ